MDGVWLLAKLVSTSASMWGKITLTAQINGSDKQKPFACRLNKDLLKCAI